MRNIVEDFDPSTNVEGGSIDINDEAVVDAINRNISAITSNAIVTPYVAFEKIRKILAYYKIFIPQTVFLEGDEGNEVFEISQFGEKFGVTDTGEFKSKNDDNLYLYFEWLTNDDGMIDVFAEIVDDEDLEELLADFDEEGEEEENDDSDGAEPTHDMYKAANMNEATLGGLKYKRKKNPNNAKSKKTSEKINTIMKDAYGKVVDTSGHMRKRLLQKGNAAFQVGLAQKYNKKQ